MTIVVNEDTNIDQVFRQMYKIVEVIKIKQLDEKKSVIRDLALVKIKITPKTCAQILKNLRLFEAKVIEKKANYLIAEICGEPEKINEFLVIVKKSGLLEVSRTGATALSD